MKRRRPEPILMKRIRAAAYIGEVIPPRSIVKLVAPWGEDRGRVFRIGYYRRQDGLNCVWLVNESGAYEQTTDQKSILQDFEILKHSNETDWYGIEREILEPVSNAELLKLAEV